MTTQYTPGPWFVRQRKHVVEIDNGLESPDYRHITNALPWSDGGPIDKHGVSLQVLADARLIAAAPKLLETLEGVRRIVANQLDNALFPSKGDASKLTVEQAHVRERLGMASRMAHNAIAEAKGELRK